MKRLMLILLLMLSTPAFGQQVITGFDSNKDLPILNEELRNIYRRVSNAENIDVANEVTGILPVANGGTGVDLSTNNQGDIYYDNGTGEFTRLTPGTNGYFLKTQGANANPIWASAAINDSFQFISSTPMSNATNSNDIAISANVIYKVIIDLKNATDGGCTVSLRFNSDETANYANVGESVSGTDSLEIDLSITDDTSATSVFLAELVMHTIQTDWMAVTGDIIYSDNSALVQTINVSGIWDASTAVTSFEIVASNGVTGNILLYKFNES